MIDTTQGAGLAGCVRRLGSDAGLRYGRGDPADGLGLAHRRHGAKCACSAPRFRRNPTRRSAPIWSSGSVLFGAWLGAWSGCARARRLPRSALAAGAAGSFFWRCWRVCWPRHRIRARIGRRSPPRGDDDGHSPPDPDLCRLAADRRPRICAAIKAAGYTTVIDNRPDAEIPADLHTAAMQAAAEALGLTFVDQPGDRRRADDGRTSSPNARRSTRPPARSWPIAPRATAVRSSGRWSMPARCRPMI